jgi:hypothetical protein
LSDEDEIFAGFDSREHSRLITLLQRAANEADLPDSIHPGLRRRRRSSMLATGDWSIAASLGPWFWWPKIVRTRRAKSPLLSKNGA